jgi:hypothetical protein
MLSTFLSASGALRSTSVNNECNEKIIKFTKPKKEKKEEKKEEDGTQFTIWCQFYTRPHFYHERKSPTNAIQKSKKISSFSFSYLHSSDEHRSVDEVLNISISVVLLIEK